MRLLSIILIGLLFFSCRNSEQTREKTPVPPEDSVEVETEETFTSQKWNISAEIPEGIEVFEGELPGRSPVINFYDPSIEEEPPYGIHNDAEYAYIAVLPEGYGVDGPAGPRESLADWEGHLPLSFEVDRTNSFVYLLESGEPWAISLSFYAPPTGWNQYGGIYVFYAVDNFRAECFSSNTGEEITMEECNPLGGDPMKFYGDVSEEKRAVLNAVLESIYFMDPNLEREDMEDLIKVEQPQAGQDINSPLKISGEARGYWFFEATAPVSLISENGTELAEGYIQAQGDWMTEDWVSFEGDLDFETKEKRGYLKFNRANASGKPEHDRILRLPVNIN